MDEGLEDDEFAAGLVNYGVKKKAALLFVISLTMIVIQNIMSNQSMPNGTIIDKRYFSTMAVRFDTVMAYMNP